VHLLLALQVAVDPTFRIEPAWVITTLMSVLGIMSTVIGVLYRGQVKALETESHRKDELIDELVKQIGRTADVQDRTVSVVEQRERGRR
jgi:ABC-type hemin transport system substrate-binding protein